jgi:tetratricopeptide (TPR) repeat protein
MSTELQLDTLEAKGLIRPASYRPELEYLFRHALIQDAAYGSLLRQERRQLHRVVGESLEILFPERTAELAGVLARHFEEAGVTDKALEYLVSAGTYALERNAINEAYSAFDRAAKLLPPPRDGEDSPLRRRRVEVEIGRVRAGWTFRPIEDLIADLEAILPTAEGLGELELIAPIHLSLALARLQLGESASEPALKRSLDRVAEIAEAIDDPSLRALPLALVGLTQVFTGPIRDGVSKLEEAVPLLERRQDFIGASFARGALAIGYANLGEFAKADAAARNATELAASGDLIAQLDALIAESMVRSMRGRLDEAVPLARTCVERAEETGATACVIASSWVLGDAYERLGRFEEARQSLQRGHEISLVVDRMVWRPTLQAWLGLAKAALGDPAMGDREWDEALATTRSIHNRVGEAGILWKRAQAAAKRGETTQALTWFAESAAIAEELGARPQLARVLRDWGETLHAAGRTSEGSETLRRALTLFVDMGIVDEAEAIRTAIEGSGVPRVS